MQTLKNILIIILIPIFGFAFFILYLDYLEEPKSEFSNYVEAKTSGIMDRGWIPTYIPKSAIDIQEQHDIDTNWVKMTFKYTIGDIKDTKEACESMEYIDNGIKFNCKYFSNNVSIILYDSGYAKLSSSPDYKNSNKYEETNNLP
ncbi:MAG: hypothetical protein U9R27_10870 [Campylobacterota bacterium]|nr:hypothetical protein [Campylobacterota bacterium]